MAAASAPSVDYAAPASAPPTQHPSPLAHVDVDDPTAPLLPPGPLTAAATLPIDVPDVTPVSPRRAARASTAASQESRRPLLLVLLGIVVVAVLAAVAAFVFPGFLTAGDDAGRSASVHVQPKLEVPAALPGLSADPGKASRALGASLVSAAKAVAGVTTAAYGVYRTATHAPVYFVGGTLAADSAWSTTKAIGVTTAVLGRKAAKPSLVAGTNIYCAALTHPGQPAMIACSWDAAGTYGLVVAPQTTPAKAAALTVRIRSAAVQRT